MAERKVVPFDEFYYQLKLMHLFQKHSVYTGSLKSMDTTKYFQNDLAELVDIWHTVRNV
jgi:hypothetical protein